MRTLMTAVSAMGLLAMLGGCDSQADVPANSLMSANNNSMESASAPDNMMNATNAATNSAEVAKPTTFHGNTDHGNTDHGNTDHGNTDH